MFFIVGAYYDTTDYKFCSVTAIGIEAEDEEDAVLEGITTITDFAPLYGIESLKMSIFQMDKYGMPIDGTERDFTSEEIVDIMASNKKIRHSQNNNLLKFDIQKRRA